MGLRANDPRPQHQQIADDLRDQIASGQFAPGDRLPTIKDLMERYGVYNQAVQAALKILHADGLTNGVPGRGTFVRTDLDPRSISHVGGDEPSPEFVALNEKLDELADEIQTVKDRLSQVEARQGPATGPRSTTKSS